MGNCTLVVSSGGFAVRQEDTILNAAKHLLDTLDK